MKKSLLSLAIVAGMAVSGAALAEVTVYGNVHLSIDDDDKSLASDEITMNSNTSSIGVKGSEDLGDGMKALFLVEFQVDPSEVNGGSNSNDNDTSALVSRDQWVGLKGGMGTVKFGTVTSNYKQLGGKIDPMYRTQLEGRGSMMKTQSNLLHSGAGRIRGRMTDAVQYESPEMGGMSMVINTTVDGQQTSTGKSIDETLGVGFRYEGKGFMAYLDFIDISDDDGTLAGDVVGDSATKIGGKFKAGPVTLGAQYESAEDVDRNFIFLSADYSIDGNNAVYLTAGQRDDSKGATSANGSTSVAVMYDHNMSKQTNLYVGYGDRSDDASGAPGESITTLGIRKKF